MSNGDVLGDITWELGTEVCNVVALYINIPV